MNTSDYIYISSPTQCPSGLIFVTDSYSGRRVGIIDMVQVERSTVTADKTLNQLYAECHAEIVCSLVLTAAETYILSKVKIAWKFFRGLTSLSVANVAMPPTFFAVRSRVEMT
jgi:hypothetical protein